MRDIPNDHPCVPQRLGGPHPWAGRRPRAVRRAIWPTQRGHPSRFEASLVAAQRPRRTPERSSHIVLIRIPAPHQADHCVGFRRAVSFHPVIHRKTRDIHDADRALYFQRASSVDRYRSRVRHRPHVQLRLVVRMRHPDMLRASGRTLKRTGYRGHACGLSRSRFRRGMSRIIPKSGQVIVDKQWASPRSSPSGVSGYVRRSGIRSQRVCEWPALVMGPRRCVSPELCSRGTRPR